MITIQIDKPYQENIETPRLEGAVLSVFKHHETDPDSGVSILVSDDGKIQALNKEFLDVNTPTDVLSFPAGFDDPESGHIYLGDMIISFPRAQAQAEAGGHPVMEEIILLVVHGMLHLLGYDHAGEEEKERMWQVQDAILEELGVGVRPND
jgi:probable rRNA maturation factor